MGAVLLFLAGAGFLLTSMAFADSKPIPLQNPLGSSCNDLSCPAQKVADFLFTIAVPLSGIMILVGGFQMMTAAGNKENYSKGKKTLLYAVIGFVVVLLAGSVASLIQKTFSGS